MYNHEFTHDEISVIYNYLSGACEDVKELHYCYEPKELCYSFILRMKDDFTFELCIYDEDMFRMINPVNNIIFNFLTLLKRANYIERDYFNAIRR